ncbi:MAG TPA: homoserine dehydrogenase [Blastocatellia bacterium]|nr:homoserine dehydrogenase [Blastocatellia bacterium]
MEVKLAFVGFGNVARAFARMLESRRALLDSRYSIQIRVKGIATARHGSIITPTEIDLLEVVDLVERGQSLVSTNGASECADSLGLIERCDADVVFETSPLNPTDGEPAVSYIRRALERGISVVTANKGPIAFAYRELAGLAKQRAVHFRFEGTVMDGAPVFNLAELCLPGVKVTGFSGVLNSTTNLVLTRMEEGASFDQALEEARALGVTEADSAHDIDGWDAAVKTVALANVLMNADARPNDVSRRGIRGITVQEVKAAGQSSRATRLVSRAELIGSELKLSVAPEQVASASPMGAARGTSNVLVLNTDLMGDIAIFETDPGVQQTAYALLSDLLTICASVRNS